VNPMLRWAVATVAAVVVDAAIILFVVWCIVKVLP